MPNEDVTHFVHVALPNNVMHPTAPPPSLSRPIAELGRIIRRW